MDSVKEQLQSCDHGTLGVISICFHFPLSVCLFSLRDNTVDGAACDLVSQPHNLYRAFISVMSPWTQKSLL